jgi:hypothetical protein
VPQCAIGGYCESNSGSARAGGVRQKPEKGLPEADARDRRQRVKTGPRQSVLALSDFAESTLDGVGSAGSVEPSAARDSRLYVRLLHEDRLLLRERAAARGMGAATYVSVLVRSHLRNVAPLPKEELSALKRSVAELGAIGRNMNQIARAASQGGKPGGPDRDDVWAMLRVAEALRDHVKALLKANLVSWRDSNAGEPSR